MNRIPSGLKPLAPNADNKNIMLKIFFIVGAVVVGALAALLLETLTAKKRG